MKQPSVTNILSRAGSSGSSSSSPGRQSSQGSLFENIASHAKDLVRETTRQSSQEGILAHMDKVSRSDECGYPPHPQQISITLYTKCCVDVTYVQFI